MIPPIGTECRYVDNKAIYEGEVVYHTRTYGDFTVSWKQITDLSGKEVNGNTFTCGHRLYEINGRHLLIYSNKKLEDYM